MKNTLKLAAAAAFAAMFVTAPVAIETDGSWVIIKAQADDGSSAPTGPTDTGVANTGPTADAGVPNTGPGADTGGGGTGGPVTVLSLLAALGTEGPGNGGPVDTEIPGDEILSLY